MFERYDRRKQQDNKLQFAKKMLPKGRRKLKLIFMMMTISILCIASYFWLPPLKHHISTNDVEESSKFIPSIFHLKDQDGSYYTKSQFASCFLKGTQVMTASSCQCAAGWYGQSCDIPEEVQQLLQTFVRLHWKNPFRDRQQRPRRIVCFLPLDEMQQITLNRIVQLKDVVDVFVYYNATHDFENSTFYEESLKTSKNRMLFIEEWPPNATETAALYARFVDKAFHRLTDIRIDDLVVFSHTNQIPNSNILLYLKLHDGFPDLISLHFPAKPSSHDLPADICTISFLMSCCDFDIDIFRALQNITLNDGMTISNGTTKWDMSYLGIFTGSNLESILLNIKTAN